MSQSKLRERSQRVAIPAVVFALTATTYALVLGPRAAGPSENNHYAVLAESWLHGQHALLDRTPPGSNDWACYDEELRGACLYDAMQVPRDSQRWYVSFPPFPAAVILPAVAIFGRTGFSDPLFWALFAGLAPALLYVLLRSLRDRTQRSVREDLMLVAVFAFGSVYFSTAVQGSVWFAAHVVASALLCAFLLFAIDARRPLLAGLMLMCAFLCRPTVLPFGLFFVLEALRVSRASDAPRAPEGASVWRALYVHFRGARIGPVVQACALFAIPVAVVGALAMWMNEARFHDPFEFGHTFLQIRWRPRIEKWGLFNYHYVSKNLAVLLASLPWLSATSPYVTISRHGLALWVTSPNLVPALWPKRVDALMAGLFASTALVAIFDLAYQNSGWVQFGYRFSLDYMPALIVLLALSKRRFGAGFVVLLLLAIAINAFGAITFDRAVMFYDDDASQDRVFQPD